MDINGNWKVVIESDGNIATLCHCFFPPLNLIFVGWTSSFGSFSSAVTYKGQVFPVEVLIALD